MPINVAGTPRNLPQRRRSGDRSGWKLKVAGLIIGLLGTIASGYYSGLAAVGDRERSLLDRIAKLEGQRESDHKAVMGRLDDLKEQFAQQRTDTRADINGIRDEILRIIRSSR